MQIIHRIISYASLVMLTACIPPKDPFQTSPSLQKKWIQKNIAKFEVMNLPGAIAAHKPSQGFDDKNLVYVLSEGLIRFKNNDWVYIVSHSMHTDFNPRKPKIGDLALAIDSRNNFYTNTNHVCGGVFLYTKSPDGFSDINHFISLNDWRKIPSQ